MYARRLQHTQYQKRNWDFVQTLLSQYRRCIDVGSNNACNAIHYAERFEWVECFEPTQLAQELWRRTVKDNGVKNVTLHTEAVGEYTGTTEILIHERNGGHNHLTHYDKNPRARGSRKARETVQVRKLDSYGFDEVDFVKIDVEGYELFVLQGAQRTLAQNRPIVQLEVVDDQLRKFDYDRTHIHDVFEPLDYQCVSRAQGCVDIRTHTGGRNEMDVFYVPRELNHPILLFQNR